MITLKMVPPPIAACNWTIFCLMLSAATSHVSPGDECRIAGLAEVVTNAKLNADAHKKTVGWCKANQAGEL